MFRLKIVQFVFFNIFFFLLVGTFFFTNILIILSGDASADTSGEIDLDLITVQTMTGDSHSQNVTYQYYEGNWYENAGVYHTPSATFTQYHRPMAWHVKSQNKTFFVYGGNQNKIMIGYYDHILKSFSVPKRVDYFNSSDAHCNPSLFIDSIGYIYVFYGSHCSVCYVKRSAEPYSITSFITKAQIPNHSYPQTWELKKGQFFHLYRISPSNQMAYRITTDSMNSWESPTVLTDFPGKFIYPISIAGQDTSVKPVHVIWTVYNPVDMKRKHIYYAKSTNGGSMWTRSRGLPYILPITESTAEKIFDTGVNQSQIHDITLDAMGNVYSLISTGQDSVWYYFLLTYKQQVWSSHFITMTDHQWDVGCLIVNGFNEVRAYLPSIPVQPKEDGGDVEEWVSYDQGITWQKKRCVTGVFKSTYSHNFIRSVYNGSSDLRCFWSYGDSKMNACSRMVKLIGAGDQSVRIMKYIP